VLGSMPPRSTWLSCAKLKAECEKPVSGFQQSVPEVHHPARSKALESHLTPACIGIPNN
jgi:hypothetical protein